MYLATLRVRVRIEDAPRPRRRTVQAMLDKIHAHFNVSVAELDRPGPAAESLLAFAAVGASRKEVREVLDRVADAVSAHPRAEVVSLDLTEI